MVRSIFIMVVTVLQTIILGVISIIISIFDRTGNFMGFVARVWSRIILFVSGVKVRVKGLDKIKKGNSYVFISNHLSLYDIPAIVGHIPFQFRMLAKKELYWIPLFGWALHMGGHIKIDRANREKAIKSLHKAAEKLKNRRSSVFIFAEGTRSVNGKLGKFKKGGFVLAINSKNPIVPISIWGSREIAPKKSLKIKPGKINIVIGDPVYTDEYRFEDRNRLVELVRESIRRNINIAKNM
ncbi:MAG: lysophospholipid acyltransferase family protein [Fidelibacterota bacterium]